jgi:site-specific DNA-methyltransferase (adenine-specific)
VAKRPSTARRRAEAEAGRAPPGLLNEVTVGDCIEGMRLLPDRSVDVAIIDPPYNLGKGARWSWDGSASLPGFGGAWQKAMQAWDDHTLMDYFRFTLTWLTEVKRVVKPAGSFWVHGTYHNVGVVNFALQLLEVEIINEVVWYKRNSFPNLAGRRLTASHETILWAHTGKRRQYLFNYEDSKRLDCPGDLLRQPGKQMRTVWDVPNNKERSELRFGRHPTQKPLRLLRRMLALSAPTRGVCLVPFAGAGSECVAATERGLDFVAFEADAAYAGIARRRLADARSRPITTRQDALG